MSHHHSHHDHHNDDSCNCSKEVRNLLPYKEQYNIAFANLMYDQFRKLSYGIATCSKSSTTPDYLIIMRKQIVDHQSIGE